MNTPTLYQSAEGVDDMPNLPRLGRSFLWLLLFMILYVLAAVFYFMIYGMVLGFINHDLVGTPEFAELMQNKAQQHAMSPSGISGVILMQFALITPVLFMVSGFKTQSWRDTLGMNRFSLKSLGLWLLILIGYLLVQILVNSTLGMEETGFIQTINGSRSILLSLVMIGVAPLLEELLFRGYLFKAWRASTLGLPGTLVLTSLLFTLLHFGQYNWVLLFFLFTFSIILGLAREKSGSVWIPVILHSVNNIVCVVSLVFIGIS